MAPAGADGLPPRCEIAPPNPLQISLNATSRRRRPIVCGSPTSATFQPGPAFCTWRWCSTRSAARLWAGRWKLICAPNWYWQRLTWRSDNAGVRPSMGSVGDCFDNAMCESFFATLECELLDRRRFKTQIEARMAIFEFIEGWYNPHRRHSALDYLSPIDYERAYGAQLNFPCRDEQPLKESAPPPTAA